MAAITSAANGNWSAGATWNGGVVPTAADTVTILNTHTVTLDNTTCVANTLATNVGSTLTCTTANDWTLTLQRGGMLRGILNLDMSAVPAVDGTIIYHAVNNTVVADGQLCWNEDASTQVTLKGYPRKRLTNLTTAVSAGATSISVVDATGWRVGDRIALCSTQAYNATPKTDYITIDASYTNGSTTVPLASALVNDHANDCYVGNFSSNLLIRPGTLTDNYAAFGALKGYGALTYLPKVLDNVLFLGGGQNSYQTIGAFTIGFANGGASTDLKVSLSNCAFAQFRYSGCYNHGKGAHAVPVPITNCVFYSDAVGIQSGSALQSADPNSIRVDGCGVFRATGSGGSTMALNTGITLNNVVTNSFFSGTRGGVLGNGALDNVHIFGNFKGLVYEATTGGIKNCTFGTRFAGATNTSDDAFQSAHDSLIRLPNYTYRDTSFGGTIGNCVAYTDYASVTVINKNLDVTQQEIYRPFMTIKRDNSTVNRSASSIAIRPLKVNVDCTRELSIPCAAGSSVRVVGYVKRQSSATQSASVALTGLGAAWGGFTAANNTSWQAWDTGTITNSSGVDGNFTLTYTAADTSSTAGVVYFDGVPDSPFVTKCRHYGFAFDEANAVRTVNASTQANEATASAYSGITIGWGTSASTITLTADATLQYLYDYTQYQACQSANMANTPPLNGVGIAGAVSLFAQGDVTTTGHTLNDGGSLSMGAYTLTGSVPWNYTYTGGTFTQAATVPSFSGGNLNIGAAGTYTADIDSAIVSMTPTAPSTYDLGAGTYSGTLDLRNTTAHAITVQIPGGTTYTTANNTGGTITVSAPVVTQGLAFTGLIAGSQVKVFAAGTQTELFSASSSGTSETWSQVGGSNTTVDYTVMKAGYLPIRLVGITVNSAVVGAPISQVVDRSYAASTGLAYGTTATIDTGTSRFTVTTATTVQNWYSFMIESWIVQAALKNTRFPVSSNGPNSFALEGWEFSAGVNLLKQDGLRYTSGGTATAIWAALYSVDTAAGLQIRYQQTDGGTTVDAANTGKIDQLVQVYGDAAHGNFDKRTFLVLKAQKDGYDQAETDVVATYGALEDQFYVVGLNPASNGLTTGAPTVNGTPTITDHGASPVTWHSKAYSVTITDSAAGNDGETLMRWIRYSLGLGGTFEGKDTFAWHDLVRTNGSGYKTVRGGIYGDTGAALKGVRVITNAGADHPDFNLHTADDGTTYTPPQQVSIAVTGVVAGSRVQIYDTANGVELLNSTSVYAYTEPYSVARTIRIRVAKQTGAAAHNFIEANAGSIGGGTYSLAYPVSQSADATYNTNAIDGSTVTGITITPSPMRVVINIAGGAVTWPQIYAYQVYWLATATGIADEAAFISAPDTANYLLTNFDIKNTSTVPLTITGGYGRDAVTGLVKDCIDTAGSTGNIFPMPDHAIPYSSGSGLTAGQAAQLAAVPDATTVATAVWNKTLP